MLLSLWYGVKGIAYSAAFLITVCVGGIVLLTVLIVGTLIEIGKGEKTL